VERLAIADRQALAAATLGRVENFEWLDVDKYVGEWERWLTHDPADTDEARADARMRELMEEAA